ncbi:hypothetical protein MTR67_041305 [Solanum verrucosum]|uniref:Uncharacterized protein n=1 Tax=Solanum verrucosum TaxID=315347 RepID=A0AAF0UKK2_SOLVR|nr:hypothetical protein MTR67_041305 [Solanum verrucosum]
MYSGSSTGASLIHLRVRVSYVSHDEGSLGDQQWFLSVGHVHGVDSGRDNYFDGQIYLSFVNILVKFIIDDPIFFFKYKNEITL